MWLPSMMMLELQLHTNLEQALQTLLAMPTSRRRTKRLLNLGWGSVNYDSHLTRYHCICSKTGDLFEGWRYILAFMFSCQDIQDLSDRPNTVEGNTQGEVLFHCFRARSKLSRSFIAAVHFPRFPDHSLSLALEFSFSRFNLTIWKPPIPNWAEGSRIKVSGKIGGVCSVGQWRLLTYSAVASRIKKRKKPPGTYQSIYLCISRLIDHRGLSNYKIKARDTIK